MRFTSVSVGLSLLLSLFAFGCGRTPAELSRQIAPADAVIATNLFGSNLCFTGTSARDIVRMFLNARLDHHQEQGVGAAAGSSMRFYQGTNLLAQVMIFDELFWTPEGRFVCHPLKDVYSKLEGIK